MLKKTIDYHDYRVNLNSKINNCATIRFKSNGRIFSLQHFVFIALSLWLLMLNIASANREFTYKVSFDSSSINHWETKNQIVEVHDRLTDSVKEEYYYEIISQGIKEFEIVKDSSAKLVNNQIIITLGDGKGLIVEGSFQKNCNVEVKRKSIIMDLFGKLNN